MHLSNDELNRAANQFGLLKQARQALEASVLAWGTKDRPINAVLELLGDGTLVVRYLGFALEATPRTVMLDGDTALEYSFVDPRQQLVPPVWQFYLADGGRPNEWAIRAGTAPESRICDAANPYVLQHIISGVCNGLIVSQAMQPQEL